jgi:hypothetical protein
MSRAANLLRAITFLLSTAISAGIFGGVAVWAVSTLDPGAREVIGLVSSPWLSAPTSAQLSRARGGRVVGERAGESSPAMATTVRP